MRYPEGLEIERLEQQIEHLLARRCATCRHFGNDMCSHAGLLVCCDCGATMLNVAQMLCCILWEGSDKNDSASRL